MRSLSGELRRLSGKLSYANVVSTLCLALILGGGVAYAAAHLKKNSVGTKQLKNGAVTLTKISKGAGRAQGPDGARRARRSSRSRARIRRHP
jgi:hypothetical protein